MASNLKEAAALIKQRLSIVDFFSKRGFDLHKSGTMRYVALCPFHNERTPSFSLNEASNYYHCFGCGKSGDMFTYLEEKENMTFPEAVELLASELHITIERDKDSEEKAINRKKLLSILNETGRFFWSQYNALPESHPAKQQISKRNISTANTDNYHLFGWAPENSNALIDHLKNKGFNEQDMVDAGAIRQSDNGKPYVLWRGRLMFPIKDVIGHIVGFSGRKIFEDSGDSLKGKYVNSPENAIFHKSEVLFCEDIAKKQAGEDKEIYVVEGQFDAIALQHIGKTNVVASSGTAFTQQQIALLRRFVGQSGKIIFCFDADSAGQKAALRAFKALESVQPQAYAVITKDKDPSDMYRDDPKELKHQMETMTPLWKHVLMFMAHKYDMTDEAQRLQFSEEAKTVYDTIRDVSIADSFVRLASLESSIPMSILISKLGKKAEQRTASSVLVDDVPLSTGFEALVDNVLALALEEPELRSRIHEVDLTGSKNYRFAQWMEHHTDDRIVPEMFRGTTGEEYVKKLVSLAQKFHEFDIDNDDYDATKIFEQQKEVINKEHKKIRLQKYLAQTSSMLGSKDPDVLREFDRKLREIAQSRVD
jgi:DNA primase